MTSIFKILPRTEWEQALSVGRFEGSAVDLADGFIHFSAADQWAETARRHFAGQDDLMLLTIDADSLGSALRWEPSRGGALFPHLYAPLACDKVVEARAAWPDGMSILHRWATQALRRLEPEQAHRLTLDALKRGLGPRARPSFDAALESRLGGLRLPNPIGLAAGFDKNAQVPDAMLAAGFGFVECGTATPRPQDGNPTPRLFRLNEDRAVINRLGFNNEGVEAMAERLAGRRRTGVVGANIGANKDSADRIADYLTGLRRLWVHCDYFTLNISSPNTPGLRDLQSGGALDDLLAQVAEARWALAYDGDRPIYLKVAPDLTDKDVTDIVEATKRYGLQGLIVGNTTLARPEGLKSADRTESGGLSGAPLMDPSTRLLRSFHEAAGKWLVLIGAGGVASGADAYAKIRAGASAVQLYTALIYEGPDLVARIRHDLTARLRADGFSSASQAVGAR